MKSMTKWLLAGVGVVLVVGVYQMSGSTKGPDVHSQSIGELGSLPEAPTKSDEKENPEEVSAVKDLESEVAEDAAEEPQEEVQQTGEYVKVDIKSLLKIMGATDHLTWQEEYDKGVYTASYDATWKDDMFNRAHELVIAPEFSDDIEISQMECKDDECGLKLRKIPSSEKGGGSIASDYVLALKNHPAILESGRSRNVYVNSIRIVDGEQIVDVVVL